MRFNIEDDKTIALIAMILGLFTAINVDPQIGTILFGMSAAYAIAIFGGNGRAIEFSKSKESIIKSAAIGSIAVGLYLFAITVTTIKPLSIFASAFSFAFTTADPFIKFMIFGLAVPLFETLFFLLVIFPLIGKLVKYKNDVKDKKTILAALLTGFIVASFHLTARIWNKEAFLVDMAFFALSAIIVSKFRQGKEAFVMHAIINGYVVSKVNGWI